jgi:hypothetical protein
MPGHRKFRDLVAPLMADPVRRAQVEAGVRAMNDISALAALRERRDAKQSAVVGAPGVSQQNVSELKLSTNDEEDVYLSTLRHYVEALGGRLEITAVFPDETIRLLPAIRESEGVATTRS